jgi:hypothetical protein
MKGAWEYNAAVISSLHKAIHATFKRRSESDQAWEEWQRATAEFHARYDELAFPGGLTLAFECLAAADMTTAETAIIFLELHPRFFRSQYNATAFTRLLRKIALRPDLQKRFDAVMAAERERKLAKKRSL